MADVGRPPVGPGADGESGVGDRGGPRSRRGDRSRRGCRPRRGDRTGLGPAPAAADAPPAPSGADPGRARWARPVRSRPAAGDPGPDPGRRRPAGWSSVGWAGGWWRPSGRSRCWCSGRPSPARRPASPSRPSSDGEGPVVAASVKADLLEHTAAHRADTSGGSAASTRPASTGRAATAWSPLPASRTWPGARRAASTLTEVGRAQAGAMSDGDFWYATAGRLLAPLLFAAATSGRDMADVVRWVETGEEDEVLELLDRAGVPEAVDAARSAFAKEERQRSSIVTTRRDPARAVRRRRPVRARPELDAGELLAGSDTLYLCAPAHDQRRLTPLFVGRAPDRPRPRLRPGGPHRPATRPAAARGARRGGQHRPGARPRRPGGHRRRSRHPTGDRLARPGPDHRPLRSPGHDGGEQPPGQALPVGHLGPADPGLRQPPDRRRGGAPRRHHGRWAERVRAPPGRPRSGAWPRRTRCAGCRPGPASWSTGDLPPARLTLRTWFDDPWLRARAQTGTDGSTGRPPAGRR